MDKQANAAQCFLYATITVRCANQGFNNIRKYFGRECPFTTCLVGYFCKNIKVERTPFLPRESIIEDILGQACLYGSP
jgi:hypothetical protein